MLNKTLLALVLLSLASVGAGARVAAGGKKPPPPLARSRQLVLVTTRDWDAVGGVLRRFERKGARGAWAQVGAEVPVVVGRTGLAWGVGLVEVAGAAGPRKREGDGKSPAGVFLLGPAFGFAEAREASARLRLPYKPLTPSTECVDDAASRQYNLVVDRDALKAADWNSSERMREVEGYRWGLVVAHNAAPPAPGSAPASSSTSGPAPRRAPPAAPRWSRRTSKPFSAGSTRRSALCSSNSPKTSTHACAGLGCSRRPPS